MCYRFSVILPSYLEPYKHAATDRERKFCRAVDSLLAQTLTNWQLVIISDGCQKTVDLYKKHYSKHKNILCLRIKKQTTFSGFVRQAGINYAQGDYIIYLDTDDYYGPNHLQNVSDRLASFDWVYFDNTIHGTKADTIRNVSLRYGISTTSTICHKNTDAAGWDNLDGYTQDWKFIERLIGWSKNYGKIEGNEYYICHIAGQLDN